jgi:hypothetical protein
MPGRWCWITQARGSLGSKKSANRVGREEPLLAHCTRKRSIMVAKALWGYQAAVTELLQLGKDHHATCQHLRAKQ